MLEWRSLQEDTFSEKKKNYRRHIFIKILTNVQRFTKQKMRTTRRTGKYVDTRVYWVHS